MNPRIIWTDAQDSKIRRLRAEGSTWDAIAAELGFSRFATIERGRRIGARRPPAEPRVEMEDLAREPLPAGHPKTWGALTAGTLLDGAAYPFPVFQR